MTPFSTYASVLRDGDGYGFLGVGVYNAGAYRGFRFLVEGNAGVTLGPPSELRLFSEGGLTGVLVSFCGDC